MTNTTAGLAAFESAPRPPLRSNLQAPTTRLIGREREVQAVRQQICRSEVRIVVVTGPGGVGKTRLAVEVAAEVRREFRDGVFFVPLAPVRSPELVIPAIAQTLGVREAVGQSMHDALIDHLRSHEVLLLLDNFEQVAEAGASLADLLVSCTNVKMLITSRAVLQIYGEQEFPLAPLTLPAGSNSSVELLRQSEAVLLFEERARAADPGFALTTDNASAVAEICRRLDGLPLAIELAAARVRLLSPVAMLARFGRRLPLLVGQVRGVPERQRTLRHTIDWSYDLLGEDERALFRQLGAFVSGWTLAAAQAVVRLASGAETASWTEHELIDGVQSLLDKSLLRHEPGSPAAGEPRLGMLETIAEYAVEKLDEHGETDQVMRRHTAYYIQLAEQADPNLFAAGSQAWFMRLESEHDNLRRALHWCLETRRIEAGFRLATALWWFWAAGRHLAEGRTVLCNLLAAAARPTRGRAAATHAAGSLAFYQGDLAEARRLHEEELELQRHLADPAGALAALESLALVAVRQGDPLRAHGHLDEALRAGRELGGLSILFTLSNLANVCHEEGDFEQARALLEEAVEGLRSTDRTFNLSFSLLNLGTVARDQGDLDAAQAFSAEALQVAQQVDQQHLVALCLVNLGSIDAARGHLDDARALFERGLLILADIGDCGASAAAIERCAEVAAAQGQYERGLKLAGAATSLRHVSGLALPPRALKQFEVNLEPARRVLGPTAAANATGAGAQMSLQEAVDYALERSPLDPGPLTPREFEVAALVAERLSNRQIAERLVISERTADNHLQHILNKLDLPSRAHLAAWVTERRSVRRE
jgi:predicted ATPase/DNA-binding CsgD family transcriptional regulator